MSAPGVPSRACLRQCMKRALVGQDQRQACCLGGGGQRVDVIEHQLAGKGDRDRPCWPRHWPQSFGPRKQGRFGLAGGQGCGHQKSRQLDGTVSRDSDRPSLGLWQQPSQRSGVLLAQVIRSVATTWPDIIEIGRDRHMDLGIRGKRALVCASSKGLGYGCAEALAEAGVNLVMNARGAEALEASAARLRARPWGRDRDRCRRRGHAGRPGEGAEGGARG